MTSIMRVRAASSGWTGGPGLNTFYFTAGPGGLPPEDTDAQLAHDRVRAAFFAAAALYTNGHTITVSPQVDVLETETGDLQNAFSVTPSAVVTGTSFEGYAPTVVMMLLRLLTSTFSDGSRIAGRAFLGPIGSSQDANGSPHANAITRTEAFGTALMDAGILEVPNLVVWRRPREAAVGPPVVTARPGSYAIVTGTSVPDKFAVLRSRRD